MTAVSAPLICHLNLARGFRGGERQTELLVRQLADRGWRQRLVARRGEPLAARCLNVPGLQIREVPAAVFTAANALVPADLVHVHEGRCVRTAFVAGLLHDIPYLVTRRVQKGPQHTWLNRWMYRRAAGLCVLSRSIGAAMHALDAGLNWTVIPSAASELAAQASAARDLRLRFGRRFLAGHVGALDDSHKGQLQIIAAARRMQSSHPDLGFVLVGSGRDEQMLRAAAGGLDNLFFTGQVSNVGDYLRSFDCFLFPSRHEGLGSILLDAMGCGLPVIATRVGGIPEIVSDGINGFLVDVDDVAAICDSLRVLIEDSGRLQSIKARNLDHAREYSAAVMADRYEKVYQQILQARHGSS